MENWIREHRAVAILRGVPFDILKDYIQAVHSGGIRMVEVALNSADALSQISAIKKEYGEKFLVGAGTVLTVRQAEEAVDAGAQFLLSPSVNEEVLAYCAKNRIEFLPGVMTPSDVAVCLRYGYSVFKLFPAGDLPKSYVKSLQGPFGGTQYVAVGGVDRHNAQTFLEQGFLGVGIGSSLIPKEFILSGRWEEAAENIGEMIRAFRGYKS